MTVSRLTLRREFAVTFLRCMADSCCRRIKQRIGPLLLLGYAIVLLPPPVARSRTEVLRHAAPLPMNEALRLAPEPEHSECAPPVRSSPLMRQSDVLSLG